MSEISRRDILKTGVFVSAGRLLLPPRWASAEALMEGRGDSIRDEAGAGPLIDLTPRERLRFDFGWRFTYGHGSDPARDLGFGGGQGDFAKTGAFEFAQPGYDDSRWRTLDLPHDWAVELPFFDDDALESHGYKPLGRRFPETSVGWYRRVFDVPQGDAGRRVYVEFDGVLQSALVFCNGAFVGRHEDGYTPFRFDLTDFLTYGGKNAITVRVDASMGAGWFYEGAGIYRHVWLTKVDALHLAEEELVVRPQVRERDALLHLSAVVENKGARERACRVGWQILDGTGGVVATAESRESAVGADERASVNATATLENAKLWSLEQPNLYYAVAAVVADGESVDRARTTFGVRTLEWDLKQGFLLNGKKVLIQGTCNHQDHAGVGAALPDRLQWFRLGVLREMGCNAIRTSHNCPTPELIQACDQLGMLVLCETRTMSANEEALGQLAAMIRRYRNSPSIFLWSMGNEEWFMNGSQDNPGWKTHEDEAGRVIQTMQQRAYELDPTRKCTAAVNGYVGTDLAHNLDVMGFNYNLGKVDPYRAANSEQPLIATETASERCTRGVYSTDVLRNWVSSYDEFREDSSVEEARAWWHFCAERPWLSGGFAWTGFDYRGEPSPYGWPSISSQFGIADTCGFPKDNFFYYKAWWSAEPVLHLYPHWNWPGREGQEVRVQVESNLERVELLLNGQSLGTKSVKRHYTLEWKVKYSPGILEARGMRGGSVVMTERRETTGKPVQLVLSVDRSRISADGTDVAMVRIGVLDAQGREVPTAGNLVKLKIQGEGRLIGVGNGDPNCHESDKGSKRSLFQGLAQAIVQSTKQPGDVLLIADADDLRSAKISIKTEKVVLSPEVA